MNNYFCVLPFFGGEYNNTSSFTPCCLLDLSKQSIESVKQEMLAKKRPNACAKCWHLEDKGHESDRQLKNKAFDYYTNTDIQFVEQNCVNGQYSKKIIKLYTSNLCNSTCVTCGPTLSTAWGALEKKRIPLRKINDTLLDFDYKNITMLSFVGGEPLYESKNFEILENLLAAGNDSCFVSFVTNGSVNLKEREKDILSKFSNLNICLSIDGVGPVFEYMRYPLKWNTLLDNLSLFKKITKNISISFTISNINQIYSDKLSKWAKEQELLHNQIIVSNPSYFSPSVLPSSTKFIETVNEIKRQDRLKGISIIDYLPEFYNTIPNHLKWL